VQNISYSNNLGQHLLIIIGEDQKLDVVHAVMHDVAWHCSTMMTEHSSMTGPPGCECFWAE